MARALEQILQELDSVYNPQKDVYNSQLNALPGQEQAELGGLEAAKTDSFNQIVQGANRRGVAFGGIPLGEQASYLGQQYLPAVANLKGKFQGQRSDLALRLAELAGKQRSDAYSIRDSELSQDAQAAAARASAAGSASPSFSGGAFGGNSTGVLGASKTLRQTWQDEANAGDRESQILLNYVDDVNRYDGPVKSLEEYTVLKNAGVVGSYYYQRPISTSNGGLSAQGGGSGTGTLPAGITSGKPGTNRLGL